MSAPISSTGSPMSFSTSSFWIAEMRLPVPAMLRGVKSLMLPVAIGVLGLQPPSALAADGTAIPFDIATVSGPSADGFSLSWRALGSDSVQVFASPSPSGGRNARLIGKGGADGTLAVDSLSQGRRWYFTLKPDHGDALTIADRGLHLASAPNFRDLGGLRTADGRWVRMALLYRSDQLNRLTEPDLAALDALHLATIYDFRTDRERQAGPDKTPSGAHEVVADVLADQKVPTDKDMAKPTALKQYAAGGAASFADGYRHFVSSPVAAKAYHEFLA